MKFIFAFWVATICMVYSLPSDFPEVHLTPMDHSVNGNVNGGPEIPKVRLDPMLDCDCYVPWELRDSAGSSTVSRVKSSVIGQSEWDFQLNDWEPRFVNTTPNAYAGIVTQVSGLKEDAYLQISLKYSLNERLTIRLYEKWEDEILSAFAPLEYTYIGTGEWEIVNIPIKDFVQLNWLNAKPTQLTSNMAIGFTNLVRGKVGSVFPEHRRNKTTLGLRGFQVRSSKLFSFSNYEYKLKHQFDVNKLDDWGRGGSGLGQSLLLPESDVYYEGNSIVLDMDLNILGNCDGQDSVLNCVPLWNFSESYTDSGLSWFSYSYDNEYVNGRVSGWKWFTNYFPVRNETAEKAFQKANYIKDLSAWSLIKVDYQCEADLYLKFTSENDYINSKHDYSTLATRLYCNRGELNSVWLPVYDLYVENLNELIDISIYTRPTNKYAKSTISSIEIYTPEWESTTNVRSNPFKEYSWKSSLELQVFSMKGELLRSKVFAKGRFQNRVEWNVWLSSFEKREFSNQKVFYDLKEVLK